MANGLRSFSRALCSYAALRVPLLAGGLRHESSLLGRAQAGTTVSVSRDLPDLERDRHRPSGPDQFPAGAAPYSSSETCSLHVAPLPCSSTSNIAMCAMNRVADAPCQ